MQVQATGSAARSPVLLSHTWFHPNLPFSKALVFPNQCLGFSEYCKQIRWLHPINHSRELVCTDQKLYFQCKLYFLCDLWWLEIIERQLIFCTVCPTALLFAIHWIYSRSWSGLHCDSLELHAFMCWGGGLSGALHILQLMWKVSSSHLKLLISLPVGLQMVWRS